jgi:hypothetical protein
MSSYDREADAIAAVGRFGASLGKIGEFLFVWLLASLGSWLVGAPMLFILLFYWLGWTSPEDEGGKVAVEFVAASLAAGLVLLGAFSMSGAERYIRAERRQERQGRARGQND